MKSWISISSTLVVVTAILLALFRSYYSTSDLPAPRRTPAVPTPEQAAVCKRLIATLPDVAFATGEQSYENSINSYWSATGQEISPSCVVRVRDAQDVSAAIGILKTAFDSDPAGNGSIFAVRSGGHSPEGHFSNVQNGAVLDLSRIDHIRLSDDHKTIDLGVGAHWRDVTTMLDPLELSIAGGRASDVGIGGFLLGGGLSFFSARFGMSCDNVDEYEVVLADGTITTVTSSQHPDLWKALKGGTGNFGVVTRMKMRTFSQGKIWAGYAFWAHWQASKVLKAFYEFNKPENFDPYAGGPLLALGHVPSLGFHAVVSTLLYTKPEPWPKAFQGFKSIWRVLNTHKIQTVTSATNEVDAWSPPGLRQLNYPTTIKNDLETFEACRQVYYRGLKNIKKVKGSTWSLVLQPLTAGITRKGDPNVLGLDTRDPNDVLVIVHVSVSWVDKKDDELVHSTTKAIISGCAKEAETRGTADPWLYLNYAEGEQDPLRAYGEENYEFLKEVSRRYDEGGFFQRAKMGGFKLKWNT